MGLKMLLVPCFLALLVPAWPVLTQQSDVCIKKPTITEDGVMTFERVRTQYEQALASRQDLSKFVQGLQTEKTIAYELKQYFLDVCPSETVTATFWNIPYQSGHRCWIIQPVSYTKCRANACQNWAGVPWVRDHTFLCKEKYVNEHVWSFCINDRREPSFVLIKVKIPKFCACTLAKC